MNASEPRKSPDPRGFPTLTFRGGGWVIVATLALLAGFLAWALSGVFMADRPSGHGSDPAAYGFRLEPLLAERETLVGTGNPRDFLPSLDNPSVLRGSDVLRWNSEHRRKLVVSTDRVAGLVVNGEARAYPLSILNAHEVVNDVLGGVPIAVTYSPLTDSLVAFDRRIGGVERTFRVSGLVLDSNLVMYDRVPGQQPGSVDGSSLWSQLGMRAIAGPEAARGTRLVPLPDVNIASWQMWLAAWPDTTVALGTPAMASRYKELSYARYCLTPRVDFPVDGLVDAAPEPQTATAALEAAVAGAPRTRKTAVIEVREGGERAAFSLAELAARAAGADRVTVNVGGRDIELRVQSAPLAAMARGADGRPVVAVPMLWFANAARW
jgi:hypothetical protein